MSISIYLYILLIKDGNIFNQTFSNSYNTYVNMSDHWENSQCHIYCMILCCILDSFFHILKETRASMIILLFYIVFIMWLTLAYLDIHCCHWESNPLSNSCNHCFSLHNDNCSGCKLIMKKIFYLIWYIYIGSVNPEFMVRLYLRIHLEELRARVKLSWHLTQPKYMSQTSQCLVHAKKIAFYWLFYRKKKQFHLNSSWFFFVTG